jgi:uncharacterized RDD family membrane protein YckC
LGSGEEGHMAKSTTTIRYAGFWIRVAAGIIDSIIVTVLFGLLASLGIGSVYLMHGHVDIHNPAIENLIIGLMIGFVLATNILYYLYFAIFESSSWQATLGMRACGLKITNFEFKRISFWRALGRELAAILSGMILYIGFFMIAFTEKKQGLHDIIADTYVIRD